MLIPLQPRRVTRQAEKHRLNVSQVAYSSFVSTAHRLLPRSSSRSTTAAITTTTAVTILLDQLRHRKSQQSPLPKGREVLPRRTALRRMHWHKQAEQHLAWPCTTSHRGTRKHPSQAEKHHKSKKARRIGLRLSSLRPASLPSSLSLPSSCKRILQQTNHQKG